MLCVRWDPVLEETSPLVMCRAVPYRLLLYRTVAAYRTVQYRADRTVPCSRTVQYVAAYRTKLHRAMPYRAVLCRLLLCVLHRANSALRSPRLSAFAAGRPAGICAACVRACPRVVSPQQ